MVFIGGINLKNDAEGGEEAKNQQIIAYFKKHNIQANIIDTHHWKKRIFSVVFQILRYTLFAKNQTIYLSLSFGSTNKLLKFLNIFGVLNRNKVYYFVIGGRFHKWLEENPIAVKNFKPLECVFPESEAMVRSLNKSGLQNVKQVPNFKAIPKVEIKRDYEIIKFVFLSRILPSKGSELIIEATKQLNAFGFQNKFCVDFFGNFDEELDPGYEVEFKTKISTIPNINYKGFLKLSNEDNYSILGSYNAMLFPTFWRGEGYPGVLIDAFIAKLPIIASDWHHNSEIVQHNNNGLLVEAKSKNDLTQAMKTLITDTKSLKLLEEGAANSVCKYDIEKVLSQIILK